MTLAQFYPLPKSRHLPASMPSDGAIDMTLEKGAPVFRASSAVQERIQTLLQKQQAHEITASESEELDRYEDIDDYLSHLNRVVRNLLQANN
ncbi:MAG: hypothetical protein GY803_00200 [Chloroflexi bacterium]|nr:hypothetical protein [Chloroflexota bacterium]